MGDTIIEVKNLKKSYYSNVVLKDISLQMSGGKFYALLGENGTGKSTLLRILMGVERPDEGHGIILGEPLLGGDPRIKDQIGYVSESLDFDVPLSVSDFMDIYGELYTRWDRRMFHKFAHDRNLDLSKKFRDYSRGQKMQLALMAALSIKPKILFIDEITSVLDIYARKFFLSTLNQVVREGCTVCMTTNIISEIQYFATDLILLGQGKVHLNCPIKEVPDNFSKLRKSVDMDHAIFQDPKCYWAGTNSDLSTSYIIPKELLAQYNLPSEFIDRRTVQLDDIFIYYYNCKLDKSGTKEGQHEAAA